MEYYFFYEFTCLSYLMCVCVCGHPTPPIPKINTTCLTRWRLRNGLKCWGTRERIEKLRNVSMNGASFRSSMKAESESGARVAQRQSLWRGHGFETRLGQLILLLGKETNRHCNVAPSSREMLIGPRHHHCSPPGRASALNCKNESLVLALGKETAAQSVISSIVWTFCTHKAKESRDERPRLRAS